ncbi:MAG: PASTA domain-containing protein [Bacteroidales bacterium]|nr:PASTA domain-containing protein [Bacteroidales bacterium]
MSLKQFLKSKSCLFHLTLIVVSFLLLLVLSFFALKIYTRQGKEFIVPNLEGKSLMEIESIKEMSNFNLIIIDSIYKEDSPSGIVLTQEPIADSKVKKGRKIYVTITSASGDELNMPLCTDISLKTAVQSISDIGLRIGNITFIPGDISNVVVEQRKNGKKIRQNDKVKRGDVIDLVVEMNINNSTTNMPDILGKTEAEAERMLWSAGLNVGKKTFDGPKDFNHSRVVSYEPTFKGLTLGTTVSLHFINDTKKSYNKTLRDFEEQLILEQNNYVELEEGQEIDDSELW